KTPSDISHVYNLPPMIVLKDDCSLFFETSTLHQHIDSFPTRRSSDLTRQFLTESLVDGERSQSKSFSSCARIGRIFSFSASSPLRFNSYTSSSNSCFIKIIFRLIRNIRKC